MKIIRCAEDLAANGATPAFPEPLLVGRPNIGGRGQFLDMVNGILDARVLSNNGPRVRELESELARYLGVRHVVAMCNGTVALEIAIRACNLEGEVLVPSYTFIASAHAISWQRLRPVFVDIDERTHNVDPTAVEAAITDGTVGIVATHLWGRPAPITELTKLASKHDLRLIFDAAHAFGCSYDGRMIGNCGDCEVLSFHATKFFNTFEGGAVTTNDSALAERLQHMRAFGLARPDLVVSLGTNAKMTEVCAAMGLANLCAMPEFLAANRHNYECYQSGLQNVPGLRLIDYPAGEQNNYQYIVVEVLEGAPDSRDYLLSALEAEGVMARKYFWPGCDRAVPYRTAGGELDLPGTRQVADRVLVLPTGPSVSAEAISTICSIMSVALEHGPTR